MNLKTSYFNFPLFKSNLKRFWWMGALYTVSLLTFGILYLIIEKDTDGFILNNVIGIGISALMPAILFSYLNAPGSVTCLHAFPIKRKAHYITNILTVLLMVLVPALICYGIGCLYVLANDNCGEYMDLILSFGAFALWVLIASSGATLGSMCTGNSIAAVAFSGIFIAFPYYSEALIKSFLHEHLYGMYPITIYTLESVKIETVNSFMVIMGIVSIFVYILSWFLYKYRRLETNGDIISYKFLKPIFMTGVSVFMGLLGYFYLCAITQKTNIFMLIPFGILGVIISFMLSKKAFTLKGIWKPIILYVLSVCAIFLIVNYDLTGFERRVPKVREVKSVRLMYHESYYRHNGFGEICYIGGGEYYFKNPISCDELDFTEEKDIENVINAHKYFINKKESGTYNIPIIYTLKNGKTIKREYSVSLNDDREILEKIFMTPQMKKANHHILAFDDAEIVTLSIVDSRYRKKGSDDNTYAIYSGGDERTKALFDAIKADYEEASYEDVASYGNGCTTIRMEYIRPIVDKSGKPVNKKLVPYIYKDYFGIPSTYKRTTALLKEYGFYDELVKPEDASYATIVFNGYKVKVTEQEKIKEIYDYIASGHRMNDIRRFDIDDRSIYGNVFCYDENSNELVSFSGLQYIYEEPPKVISDAYKKFVESGAADGDISPEEYYYVEDEYLIEA